MCSTIATGVVVTPEATEESLNLGMLSVASNRMHPGDTRCSYEKKAKAHCIPR